VQVVARSSALSGGERIIAFVESQVGTVDPVELEISGTLSTSLASGTLELPAESATQNIVYQLQSSTGELITQASVEVNVLSEADIDVELLRVEPANNAEFIEPNANVELYFNREIDLSLLSVDVRETLHGKTYINDDPLGLDFIKAKGYTLQDVNRDLEPVNGTLELIPGGSGAVFYADRMFGFKADLFVEVSYDGETLSRSTFKVRELPTFVNGSVIDQFGQPLAGVEVSIPELERSTTTNGDGGFAFGYQETGEQLIPGGRYRLLINDNFATPNFGTINAYINLQRNFQNNIGQYKLQEMDRALPFQNIGSNQVNVLAGGELTLDLSDSDAQALFTNGRTSGPVHVQFLPFEHIGVKMMPGMVPLWMFGTQPKGVELEGPVKLRLRIPEFQGNRDYISSAAYEYVVMLGYNRERDILEPVGVGKIEGTEVVSMGELTLRSMDYLGYAQVDPGLNELMEAVGNGEASLQELIARLQPAP
jgi:hypothetical protein